MKILMLTANHNDKVLAVLAFKNLNAANSIDFVSTIDELLNYITVRIEGMRNLPNLVLVGLNKDERDTAREIRANSKLKGLKVITFSTHSYNVKNPKRNDVKELANASTAEELDWILKEICTGLRTRDGWQYSIKPSLVPIVR